MNFTDTCFFFCTGMFKLIHVNITIYIYIYIILLLARSISLCRFSFFGCFRFVCVFSVVLSSKELHVILWLLFLFASCFSFLLVAWRVTAHYDIVQHSIVQYYIVQYSTVQYNIVYHIIIYYNTSFSFNKSLTFMLFHTYCLFVCVNCRFEFRMSLLMFPYLSQCFCLSVVFFCVTLGFQGLGFQGFRVQGFRVQGLGFQGRLARHLPADGEELLRDA